jgi:hypothetical protein
MVMGLMKSNVMLCMIILVVSLSFLIIFIPVCSAQATISIKDISVELLKTRPPVGQRIIREYKISVVLCNTGDTNSTNISVKFLEPEPGLTGNLTLQPLSYSLQPNEEKTFVFENWPTTLTGDVLLNISFGPSSPFVLSDSTNSGFYIYTLSIENGNTTNSTPGFQVFIVLVALFVFLLKKRYYP